MVFDTILLDETPRPYFTPIVVILGCLGKNTMHRTMEKMQCKYLGEK